MLVTLGGGGAVDAPASPCGSEGEAFRRLFACARGLSEDECEPTLVSCDAVGEAARAGLYTNLISMRGL